MVPPDLSHAGPTAAQITAGATVAEVAAAAAAADVAAHADGDAALGARVRSALGARRPWVAVQTSFSALHGTVPPGRWAAALAAYAGGARADGRDRRGANHPAHGAAVARSVRASAEALALIAQNAQGAPPPLTPPPPAAPDDAPDDDAPWAAIADVGDLAGVPACLESWGHGRMAVGATLPLSATRGMPPALLVAPGPEGYRALCRILSWHHEEPEAWAAWLEGDDAAVGVRGGERCPAWAGVVALVQDAAWAGRLARLGAEVQWRLPGPPPPAGCDAPTAVVPILTDLDGGGAPAARLMHLIQDRSQVRAQVEAVRARSPACTLADLPRLLDGDAAITDDAIARGHALARRCTYAPGRPGPDGQPPWQMPPSRWGDADAELRRLCTFGLGQRYGGAEHPDVRKRLAHELAVISRKNFASYILTVLGLAQGRRTCGRGSGASSLVCYVLGLTNVDPVKYGLVFARFLSDVRRDPPDIDIDFPWDERDRVLQAALDDYGRAHVAMVATHQRLQAAGALREAGRVLGRSREDITALRQRLRVRRRQGGGDDDDPEAAADAGEWGGILAAAEGMQGMLRGSGLHCGGLVITPGPIRDYVPIHSAAKTIGAQAVPAIAWEKDGAEAMGLVKIDLLGNRSLAVVRDVVNDLKDEGIAINEWRWAPDDDLLAHQLIASGNTIGCFYIESPAMRQLNGRAGEIDFDRLVLHSSIIRPAAAGWIATYLERLHDFRANGVNRDEWYPHPALRGLLSESFGVLSYQEDIMIASEKLAGFSIRDQDRLRKALGRSDTPQRLAALAGAFHAGCAAREVTPEVTATVWNMILSFAGYSFCKAHSASYAMVSYSCASLKAHWPAHFLARVIHNRGGFYSLSAYVEEARRLGVGILAPCCVHGHGDTRAHTARAIRLGLDLIRGLRAHTIVRVIAERDRRPFIGIHDFWRRVRPTTAELEALLDAGALDALAPNATPGARRRLVAIAIDAGHAPEADAAEADDAAAQQTRCDFAADTVPDPAPPPGREPGQRDLDRRAWAVLGCLPRAHPFALWDVPERRLRLRGITAAMERQAVVVIAWVITRKQVEAVQEHARDGSKLAEPEIRPMSFATLEDEDAVIESTWFPGVYRACAGIIDCGQPLRISATVAVDYSVVTLEVTGAAIAAVDGARGRGADRARRPDAPARAEPARAAIRAATPLAKYRARPGQ